MPQLRPSFPHRQPGAVQAAVRRRRVRAGRDAEGGARSAALSRPQALRGAAARGQAALGAGGNDALAVAEGRIGGVAAVVAAFDFAFMGGSMGVAVGEAFVAASRRAVEREAALIVVPASGGARMQEGILSLMQMPRTIIAADMVKEAGLPYIVLLTDPTTGGVSASFAMLGDITLAEPGAIIGFAGARVIEETIREKLPERSSAPNICSSTAWSIRSCRAPNGRDAGAHPVAVARAAALPSRARLPSRRGQPSRCRRGDAERRARPGQRPGADPADAAAPEEDRSVARPGRAAARGARQPGGAAAAGDPRRRHQRQGFDGRDLARLPRSGRTSRACLYLAAPRALSRTHPARRRADRRGRAARGARRMRAANGGSPITFFEITTAAAFLAFAASRPISCCSKPGSAAGSTRPT